MKCDESASHCSQASRARSHWSAVAFFFVADLFAEVFFEGWEEVEGDVGGLEVLGFGVGDVVGERAVGAEAWGGGGGCRRARGRRRSVPASRPEAMDSV